MATNGAMTPGALAPYSQDAEEALLGSILVDPFQFKLLREVVKAEDYYILRHSYIWSAFAAVADSGIELDFVSVVDALRAANRLNDVGGAGYLLHLTNATPSSQHADTYAELVRRTAVRRRLLTAADEMKALAVDEQLSVDAITVRAEKTFSHWRDNSFRETNEPIADTADTFLRNIEDRMNHPERSVGLLTPWKDFNNLTSGLVAGDFIIFGGRPRMGKTAILLNLVLHLAKMRLPVGISTMEMKREALILRMAAIEAGIDMHRLRDGKITPAEYSRLQRAINVIRSLPIWIDDSATMTPMRLLSLATRWKYNLGLVALFVDYLQLMSGGDFKENERVAEMTFITRSLKNMAGELNIPLIAGAQLNRNLESRDDKHPQLSDLRESGSIENDADLVHLLYRDKVYHPNTQTPNALEVFTAKHRNGSEGNTTLFFDSPTNKITGAIVKTSKLSDFGLDEKPRATIPALSRRSGQAQSQAARSVPLEDDTQENNDSRYGSE